MGGRPQLFPLPSPTNPRKLMSHPRANPQSMRKPSPDRSREEGRSPPSIHNATHSSRLKQPIGSPASSPRQGRLQRCIVPVGRSSSVDRRGAAHSAVIGGAADCRRRGICPICGIAQTHEPSKGMFSTKRKPLTEIDKHGTYLVYKGFCIEPTCYSLDEAKRILGEDTTPENRNGPRSRSAPARGKSRTEVPPSDKPLGGQQQPAPPPLTRTPPRNPSSRRLPLPRSPKSNTYKAGVNNGRDSTLNIRQKHLTLLDIEVLVKTKLIGVKALVLDGCGLGDHGTVSFCHFMKEFPPAQLRVLCLRQNRIGRQGCEAVASLLEQSKTLKKVRLSQNQIGNDGCVALFKAIKNSTLLNEVSLGENQIGYDGAICIRDCLAKNELLQYVSLDNNNLEDKGIYEVCQGIVSNSRTNLQTVILRNNSMGDLVVSAIAELVAKTQNVIVDVHGNNITNAGAAQILSALRESQTNSRVVGLRDNHITDGSLLDRIDVLTERKNRNLALGESRKPHFDSPPKQPSSTKPQLKTNMDKVPMSESDSQAHPETRRSRPREVCRGRETRPRTPSRSNLPPSAPPVPPRLHTRSVSRTRRLYPEISADQLPDTADVASLMSVRSFDSNRSYDCIDFPRDPSLARTMDHTRASSVPRDPMLTRPVDRTCEARLMRTTDPAQHEPTSRRAHSQDPRPRDSSSRAYQNDDPPDGMLSLLDKVSTETDIQLSDDNCRGRIPSNNNSSFSRLGQNSNRSCVSDPSHNNSARLQMSWADMQDEDAYRTLQGLFENFDDLEAFLDSA